MKSWKKRWKEELDAKIPALREDVLNADIPHRERVETVHFTTVKTPWHQKLYDVLFATPKRLASSLSVCALGLITIGVSLHFSLLPSQPLTAEAEVISVEVNPHALFSVDKDGKVTAVVALNDDADIVLSEDRDLQMEGKTAEEAVEIFVDYTAQLGYLDLETSDAVRITSCVENGRLTAIGDTLERYFQQIGAYIAVAEETLELDAFCTRANLELQDTVESLKSSVERIPALSFERESEGKTSEELQEKYREKLPLEEVKEMFNSTVLKGLEEVESMEGLLVLQGLAETLIDYSLELFAQNFTRLVGLLETFGVDTAQLKEFYELPETLEDYMQKLGNYTKNRYELLRADYIEVYEAERAKISEAEYAAYLADLVAEYGSLSEYFSKK